MSYRAAALALLLAAMPAAGQEPAGAASPPPPRPVPETGEAGTAPAGGSAPEAGAADIGTGKQDDDASASDTVPADDAAADEPKPEEHITPDLTAAEEDDCRAALDALGTVYSDAPAVTADDPACGIPRPVEVSEILPGVALAGAGPMRCTLARALAGWVRDVAVPAAGYLDRGPLSGVDMGPAFSCRRRNNAADGKLSEHAWGNGADITGFRFGEGDALTVVPRAGEGTLDEAFQRAVRAGGCLVFTTVLGPGSDAAHADHLHLDLIARSGGYRLCQ